MIDRDFDSLQFFSFKFFQFYHLIVLEYFILSFYPSLIYLRLKLMTKNLSGLSISNKHFFKALLLLLELLKVALHLYFLVLYLSFFPYYHFLFLFIYLIYFFFFSNLGEVYNNLFRLESILSIDPFLLSCSFLGIHNTLLDLMSGLYNQIPSPASARANSPNINMRSNFDIDSQYLAELLAEHQKLGPFMQVLPLCSRLLNQEILRVSGKNGLMQNQQGISDYDRMQFGSPKPSLVASSDLTPNFTGWNSLSHERLAGVQGLNVDWQTASPAVTSPHIVKKILRLDIPTDSYPNFNFVGRLLGPRGNSLKRVEATTGCRVYIRGKGSIKDMEKEELLRGRPGYEHLNDPLHVLIEAELPATIVDIRLRQAQEIIEELLKPVDESQDLYKRQQLRELAMLNSNFREDSPQMSGSVSPFTSSELKRPKIDQ